MPPYYQWWEPLDGVAGQLEAVRYVAEHIRPSLSKFHLHLHPPAVDILGMSAYVTGTRGPFDALLGFSEAVPFLDASSQSVHCTRHPLEQRRRVLPVPLQSWQPCMAPGEALRRRKLQ